MTRVAQIVPPDWIHHSLFFLSWSRGCFTLSLLSLNISSPSYADEEDVIITWSDTQVHILTIWPDTYLHTYGTLQKRAQVEDF